jgi:hypothetical protein
MGVEASSLRVRALLGVVVTGALLVLMAPSIALGANTAIFSSATPRPGSFPTATLPKITVIVHDSAGIKGAGSYRMYINGSPVTPTCSYLITGAWNPRKPDYSRIRLTYQVPSLHPLIVGRTYTVKITIRDLKRRNSTYSWQFSIDDVADPATFGTLAPAHGSRSQIARPNISVAVTDRWDVRGSGAYWMKINNVTVDAHDVHIAYTTPGAYRNFTVSYQVPATLTPGAYSIVVNVHDASGRDTPRTWSFTVLAPDVVYEEMPVGGASCGDCHTGYPALHPMTACPSCHGPGKPVPGSAYTDPARSAHTLACTLSCHGRPWTGPSPHALGSNCESCHSPAFPAIPQAHEIDAGAIKDLHASPSTICVTAGCHSSSLTAEHWRTGVNRTQLTCAGCHQSTDPLVIAAIAAKDTTCTACHDLSTLVHPDSAAAHGAGNSCILVGCHAVDVTAIHKNNCAACHGPDTSPSTTCTTCHGPGTRRGAYHTGMATAHALTEGGCVLAGCHGVGVGMDASLTHKGVCDRCHGSSDGLTTRCVTCHHEPVLDIHPGVGLKHEAPTGSCTSSDCHGTDVATIHAPSVRTCQVCHAADATASVDCSDCHAPDQSRNHPNAPARHAITATDCVKAGCHLSTDASVLHATPRAGCRVCHVSGQTATIECATCHEGDIPVIHHRADPKHASPNVTCVTSACHVADVSAVHTSCGACHGRTHALSAECTDCHDTGVIAIHASHEASHTPSADFCQTVCHANDVAVIHQSRTQCVACHNLTDSPSVVCADCHTGTIRALHPWVTGAHVSDPNGGCVPLGCHSTDVVTTHSTHLVGQGCYACHGANKTPSTVCADCHTGGVMSLHPDVAAKHATPPDSSCVATACHVPNVGTIHESSITTCRVCHDGVKTPIVACETTGCHPGTIAYLHRDAQTLHISPPTNCVSAPPCHDSDVSVPHSAPGGPSCLACHGPGITPRTACNASRCHSSDPVAKHAVQAGTKHDAPAGDCVKLGCHGTDSGVNVATLHLVAGCASCHAADKTASLVCTDCHLGELAVIHQRGDAYHHPPSPSCATGGELKCHTTDVTVLHGVTGGPGCAACHGPDIAPTAVCVECHKGVLHNPGGKHTPPAGTCVTNTCHNTDVATIHSSDPPTSGPGCAPCHRVGTLTLDCTTCHVSGIVNRHAAAVAAAATTHTAPAGLCITGACHRANQGANVATLHSHTTTSCAICHADGVVTSLNCTNCHVADRLAAHSHIGTKHMAGAGTCVADDCHGTTADGVDVVVLHAAGPGCLACHGVGKTPSLNCGAQGCHDPVPATEHDKFINAGGIDRHEKQSSCDATGCHSNRDVIFIHGATNCTPCHGQPVMPIDVGCRQANCHPAGYPAVHNRAIPRHAAVNGPCVSSLCHSSPVDGIHFAGGPKCTACHAPEGRPTVLGTTVCLDCHVGANAPSLASTPSHPTSIAADTTHSVEATSCSRPACHDTNVAAIHLLVTARHPDPPGCMACHDGAHPVSKVCSACHFSDFTTEHPCPPADHTAQTGACVKASGCHGTNVVTIHANTPLVCGSCHGNPDGHPASLDCQGACHFSDFLTQHSAPATAHAAPAGTCVSTGTGCHAANVATLHATATARHPNPPSCAACHANADHSASLTCAVCHDVGTYHAWAADTHRRASACIGSGCHDQDVTVIHVKSPVQHCEACHTTGGAADPAKTCENCHSGGSGGGGTFPPGHPAPPSLHTSSSSCISCHDSNVANVHSTCARCHDGVRTPSTVCENCHSAGSYHGSMNTAHANAYYNEDCHCGSTDLVADHGGNCYNCHYSGGTTCSWDCHH